MGLIANGSATTVVSNVYIQLFIKSACTDHKKRTNTILQDHFDIKKMGSKQLSIDLH